jgi:hypothetical protein
MKRGSKIVLGIVLALALPPLAFYFWLCVLNQFPLNTMWSRKTRHESQQILRAARTTNELAAVVGRYGCFLTFRDGSWMAIRYCDTHAGILASSSVTRDSGGAWFESSEHFCGSFLAALQQLSVQNILRELGETNAPPSSSGKRETMLLSLMTSTTLETARQRLKALGFTEIAPP